MPGPPASEIRSVFGDESGVLGALTERGEVWTFGRGEGRGDGEGEGGDGEGGDGEGGEGFLRFVKHGFGRRSAGWSEKNDEEEEEEEEEEWRREGRRERIEHVAIAGNGLVCVGTRTFLSF